MWGVNTRVWFLQCLGSERITEPVPYVRTVNISLCDMVRPEHPVYITADGGSSHSRSGHHTQTCPSNTWLPWKQPSSSLAQGGCSDIMENQTEPCQPGDVTFKAAISSLSLSVSGSGPIKYTKQENKQISMQLQAAPSWVTIFLLKWMQTPWHVIHCCCTNSNIGLEV